MNELLLDRRARIVFWLAVSLTLLLLGCEPGGGDGGGGDGGENGY